MLEAERIAGKVTLVGESPVFASLGTLFVGDDA